MLIIHLKQHYSKFLGKSDYIYWKEIFIKHQQLERTLCLIYIKNSQIKTHTQIHLEIRISSQGLRFHCRHLVAT